MTATADLDLNPGAARRAAQRTGDSERLSAMWEAFVDVASARGLFGQVPGGEAAEAALAEAASTMLAELTRTGLTVQDITDSATEVARIADQTDVDARGRLASAQESVAYLRNAVDGAYLPSLPEPEAR